MNSFIKKFIFVFFLAVGFLGVLDVSKAEACQIIDSGTNFRPSGTINSFNDEGEWIYFDVQTQNCNTNPSNRLEIRFIDIDTSNMSERPIQSVSVEIGQTGTLNSNLNFKTNQSSFTIPILLREEGNQGDCNFDDGTNWALLIGSPALLALQSAFSDIPDCMLFAKIFDTNIGAIMHSEGSVTSPKLVYECEGICDTNWVVGCPSSTSNAGFPPTPLTYGPPNICSVDDGVIPNVTTSEGAGSTTGSTLTYSEEALAPLPGFSNAPDLGEFLEALFTILIVIAGLLALIMIIVGGVTYMTSDALGKKQDGKEYVINAIVGLILALGAWVILNTINPDLAQDLNINIPVVELGNYNVDSSGIVSETPGPSGTSSICKDPNVNQVPNCPTCQAIPAPVQSQVANNRATPSTVSKLVALQSSISGIPWTVTEGFSPSRAHCARCHYIGTCIDADFTTAPTNINIKAFIDAAKSNGLKAQYETSSASEFNSLVQFGLIPKQEVLLFPGTWISGSHFSVYNH